MRRKKAVPYAYLPMEWYFPPISKKKRCCVVYRVTEDQFYFQIGLLSGELEDPHKIRESINHEGWIAIKRKHRNRPKMIRTLRDLLCSLMFIHQEGLIELDYHDDMMIELVKIEP